ncbi:MAG: efflux transporter outer membrane subunit [Candidatus Tectomicrobia bacterium]|uniref:Efflux transporter outer membrane subunit n=1 Tax=Tectimicrobiota bacterium TaxID=2528274 RepID=A0A938B0B6_UNCTE|nr:efflux transporter outer membrane subunit [Candidatus Tectomicrobia bacterium]
MTRPSRLRPYGLPSMIGLLAGLAACAVGPKYVPPTPPVPPAYKEAPPASFQVMDGWKLAEPRDDIPRGSWWTLFQDPQLHALHEQIDVSNQTLAAAEAQLRGARAAINVARAATFPTVTGTVTATGTRPSLNRSASGSSSASSPRANYQLPLDVAYEFDVWGRIRSTIDANMATAQASAADLESLRLSLHAELATNYFVARGLDAQKQLLELTIAAFERALELTTNRYNQGVASQIEVLQARTQLENTRAQAIDLGVQRSQVEHAIAILLGKPPAEFTLPPATMAIQPPAIPLGLPSELLERRPDIAAAERRVAAANAQIGVARAAFYPTVTLRSSVGFESSSLTNLFSWPSVLWSLGASLVEIAFDGGRREALTAQAQAAYEATVANYRQTVLIAFQNVEDQLAVLRILEAEAQQQDKAVQTAGAVLTLALNRYKGGITTYLEVITAQSAALAAARTAIDLTTRRLTASVLLIKALGGGWTPPDTAPIDPIAKVR